MIIDKRDNISIITQEKATSIELVKKIQALYPKFKNNNIVVALTPLLDVGVKDVVEFLAISKTHRASNQSFVIVSSKIDLDTAPEELVVVPTIQEAFDIIEMEEMERDLGL
ncbi:ribonuclease Z [Algibacter miyuki]|uniref:Ribonuclease Z n=1 Tax=Algibacter miyuki TaxID=1306933 RepID=A0ABV5H388_9FLAO|nr:ribonuclease Z [Algibacter miyuki]MDN3665411.1 ribonuclease Z [Algibacter miyuki]